MTHGWRSLFSDDGKTPEGTSGRSAELWYGLGIEATKERGELTLVLFQRERRAGGDWGVKKPFRIDRNELKALPDAADRRILGILFGAEPDTGTSANEWSYRRGYGRARYGVFSVPALLHRSVLDALARTGRFSLLDVAAERPDDEPLQFVTDGIWAFELALARDPMAEGDWLLEGRLRRGGEVMPLSGPKALLPDGLLVVPGEVGVMRPMGLDERRWAERLRAHGAAEIPGADLDQFIGATARIPGFPAIAWPDGTGWTLRQGAPAGRLSVLSKALGKSVATLDARVGFDYGSAQFVRGEGGSTWVDPEMKEIHQRDDFAENALFSELLATKAEVQPGDEGVVFPAPILAELTEALAARGWTVEAEGQRVRYASEVSIRVESGVDWLDLDGGCRFGAEEVKVAAVCAAARHGERFVRLGDGSLGILPEAWLEQFAALAALGATHKSLLRFGKGQVALLDALLEGLPRVSVDRDYEALRRQVKDFSGIAPADPGAGFQGVLRAYQREGLGWLKFLEAFGVGGCLADDMGLGKTVQVLAQLHGRTGRSLIVVPRSLVGNWESEVARFTPDAPVEITTYGLLKRDIEAWSQIEFDYVILDEAQAIKNEAAQVSKAVRLLKARHRLALTGTPVENHLGELGSIFAFLNPGMLPPALVAGLSKRSTVLFARALRPFLLRRTKEQVLADLPEKTEQTLVCELEPEQRRIYDDLRQHYRVHLSDAAKKHGVARIKIQVLEALLRLRQAACHPALIDDSYAEAPSAKLDALLERLAEVVEGGHKALVFSQFTGMLALVRKRLDGLGLRYSYLDGQTRDRDGAVAAFQKDAGVPLFLISLKAGGVGLNLTAAEYCFLLDPWWNPAVEAQAIARAHRIGQTKPVFAWRLIAKDTVEEKILALQETKRGLAESIVAGEAGPLESLGYEDLRLLLS